MTHLQHVTPLQVSGLCRRFGHVEAVDELAFSVGDGEVVGLVGPNGCGKTTTIRMLVGTLAPDRGAIAVDGLAHTSRAARARIAYAPDEPDGFDELTVDEYLGLVRALYRSSPAAPARAAALLGAFDLSARRRMTLGSLSRGLRRQVSMVAAFALDARLVIVDEATAALDPEAVIVLREAVRSIAARPAGVLVATQDLHFAELVCDRVVLMRRGACIASGRLDDLRRSHAAASLEEVFLQALGRAGFAEEVRDALDAL